MSIRYYYNLCPEYIKNPHNSRTQAQFFKMGNDLNRQFTKEDTQMNISI